MFAGIVEEMGTVERVAPRLRVRCARVLDGLAVDHSVSVQGVCLTVVARDGEAFECDVVEETRRRSALGRLATGARVNLERAATATTPLGGHFVQGHVDGTTRLLKRWPAGEKGSARPGRHLLAREKGRPSVAGERLRFALDAAWARYVVEMGFIAVDGVSLTVAALDADHFEIALIPHTAARTTLGALRVGDSVNVEVDILAKYVERLMSGRRERR